MNKVSQLIYSEEYARLMIAGEKLHCGEVLSVLLVDRNDTPVWIEAMIEYSNNGWSLTYDTGEDTMTLPFQANGLFVKRRDM